jgi:hypothetical protein
LCGGGGGGAHTNSELPQAGFPESGEVYSVYGGNMDFIYGRLEVEKWCLY